MSGPAADSEKPSDASHRWRRTRARASVAIVRFCVKSSLDQTQQEELKGAVEQPPAAAGIQLAN